MSLQEAWRGPTGFSPLVAFVILGVRALAVPAPSSAQEAASSDEPATLELEVDREYPSGSRVLAAAYGVSWIVPEGWKGALPSGSQAFIFEPAGPGESTESGESGESGETSESTEPAEPAESAERAGVGVVMYPASADVAELATTLQETQDLGNGVQLEPVGEPKIEGSQVTLSYAGGEYASEALGLIGPARQSVLYFFAGPKGQSEYHRALLQGLAESTRFSEPEVQHMIEQWNELLSGMMLKQLSSYTSGSSGGYSFERVWHLCPDGRFAYSSSSSVSMDVDGASGSSAGRQGSTGRWRVEMSGPQALLVLEAEDGAVQRLPLFYDGEKTLLDEERVFRVPSELCPEEPEGGTHR